MKIFLFFPFLSSTVCQMRLQAEAECCPSHAFSFSPATAYDFPKLGFEFIQCCLLYRVMVNTSPFVFTTGHPCRERGSCAVISAGLLLPSSKRGILGQEMQQKQIHLIFTGFQLALFPRLCSEPHCSFTLRRQQGQGHAGRSRQGGAWEHPVPAARPSPVHGRLHVLLGADPPPEPLQVCSEVEAPGRQSVLCFALFFFKKKRSSHVSWAPCLLLPLHLLAWGFWRTLISN